MIDPDNRVVQLCIAGTRAEFDDRPDAAATLYRQAWDAAPAGSYTHLTLPTSDPM